MFGNRLEPSTREPGYIPAWCAFALSHLYGSLGFIMGGNRFWHPTAQRTRWARETYLRVTIPRITRLCVQSFQALQKNSFSSPKNPPSGRLSALLFNIIIALRACKRHWAHHRGTPAPGGSLPTSPRTLPLGRGTGISLRTPALIFRLGRQLGAATRGSHPSLVTQLHSTHLPRSWGDGFRTQEK